MHYRQFNLFICSVIDWTKNVCMACMQEIELRFYACRGVCLRITIERRD